MNTKDEDKYRIVYTDKQALYESSTEEYTLQVEKFNQAQVWGFSEKKFWVEKNFELKIFRRKPS